MKQNVVNTQQISDAVGYNTRPQDIMRDTPKLLIGTDYKLYAEESSKSGNTDFTWKARISFPERGIYKCRNNIIILHDPFCLDNIDVKDTIYDIAKKVYAKYDKLINMIPNNYTVHIFLPANGVDLDNLGLFCGFIHSRNLAYSRIIIHVIAGTEIAGLFNESNFYGINYFYRIASGASKHQSKSARDYARITYDTKKSGGVDFGCTEIFGFELHKMSPLKLNDNDLIHFTKDQMFQGIRIIPIWSNDPSKDPWYKVYGIKMSREYYIYHNFKLRNRFHMEFDNDAESLYTVSTLRDTFSIPNKDLMDIAAKINKEENTHDS